MCGIVGIVDFANIAIDQFQLNYMNSLLHHRGPDCGDIFVDRNVGLAHRRLSIIDLSKEANQPMTYRDSNYWIIYNGEIYNYLELREELIQKGYLFHTQSDTEVILASFIEWGMDCFHKFNGMWALAIYNTKNQELLLCRDRFGVKPLYFYQDEKRLIFASEKKAIVLSDYVKLQFDYRGIKTAIRNPFQLEASGFSEFKNVKNLLPGHLAQLKGNKLKISRWYKLEDHLDKKIPSGFNERVDKFKTLFTDACKIRLRSDVPLATSLSGGLDSSSVVATISLVDKLKHKTFTHAFENTPLNEVEFAKIVADSTHTPLTIVKMDEENLEQKMDEIIYYLEAIYDGIPDAAFRIYEAQKSEGYKISIDGHGADEMLAGYDWYLSKYLGHTSPKKLLVSLKKLIKQMLNPLLQFRGIYPDARYTTPSRFSHLKQRLYEDFNYTILPRILKNFDAMSMANSVEVRMPFLDYRLVQYVFSLPDADLINEGWTKYILRCAMEGTLDERVNWRRDKIGFNSPVEKLLKEDLLSWTKKAIESSDNSLFNKRVLQKEFATMISSSDNWIEWFGFWKKINALKLIEIYKKRKG